MVRSSYRLDVLETDWWRRCINSCIAHLEPLNDADEMIQNVG
jgi:hypothetical protein